MERHSEEPLWRLSIEGGSESYPERPNEADCIYYLRTGFCGYGSRCRFNHPPERSSAVRAMRDSGGEYPERLDQPLCQYYMKTGMCKYGASCKYHHPRQGGGSAPPTMNIYGYPLRPGEPECSYYIKTGQCKFGITCKFHHPQPTDAQIPALTAGPSIYPSVQSPSVGSSQHLGVMASNWPIPRPSLLPGSYMSGAYSPMIFPQGMVPVPGGWTPYPAPVGLVASASAQSTAGVGQFYGLTQLSPSAPAYSGAYIYSGPSQVGQRESAYPERPGEPECQHYMRTGDCKYGSSCRYHHPPDWSGPKSNSVLSPIGLPLRPGAPICIHYSQNGVCKFGPTCKFDHPLGTLSYSPSASSLTGMPVAPFPVRSSIGTLASSSSSSDLRPSITSSGIVGPVFSITGHQQPGQSYSASVSSSMGHEGEVPTSN